MAEITEAEKVALADVLAPAFGSKRGKLFSLPQDHEALEKQLLCDLVLKSPDGEVAKFEHTRTKGNVELERIRPQHGGRVHDLLQENLKAAGVTGVIIVLGLNPPPSRAREQERVAYWIAHFIAGKVNKEKLTYFNFDVVEDWDGCLKFVSKYVYKLKIASGGPEGSAGIIRMDSRMAHLVDAVGDFQEALEKKAERYGPAASGNILVVDFEAFPLERLDLAEVEEVAAKVKHSFDEVWAVNFRHLRNCYRLWPADKTEAAKE